MPSLSQRFFPQRLWGIIRKVYLELSSDTSPISRIPDELLVLILEIAMQEMTGSFFDGTASQAPIGTFKCQHWPDLALVCRRWHIVMLNTQSFWCNIEFCTYARSQLLIERSGRGIIDIAYTEAIPQALTAERDEFLNRVFDNIGRTRGLYLSGPCARKLLRDVVPFSTAPALEMLYLQVYDFVHEPLARNPLYDGFFSNIGKLRAVNLGGVTVLPTSAIFCSNVTNLSLDSYDIPVINRLSISEVITALNKMPNLETLTLKNMLSGDESPESEPVDLPHLTHLTIHTDSVSQCSAFTHHVALPPSAIIRCHCRCRTPNDPASSVSILRHSRSFSVFRVACTGNYLSICGHTSRSSDEKSPAPGTLIITLSIANLPLLDIPVVAANVLNLLSQSLLDMRTLIIDTCESSYDWAPVLIPFHMVEEIFVRGAAWQAIVDALPMAVRTMDPNGQGLGPWCPMLHKLSFSHCASSSHNHDPCLQLNPMSFGALAVLLDIRRHRGAPVLLNKVVFDGQVVETRDLRCLKVMKEGAKWRTASAARPSSLLYDKHASLHVDPTYLPKSSQDRLSKLRPDWKLSTIA
ncbi:hypothetical protein EVG20_g8725 [Dentipellis fragilis]|uniref:Uncharacterized protein n=1 Tax=Dentipellis fragilis TaxID=205917 RepID=A0A4Y9Y451_9AGAM|nr:hypothetical protein EVG20_g8725 [Dentipellis fragilis]